MLAGKVAFLVFRLVYANPFYWWTNVLYTKLWNRTCVNETFQKRHTVHRVPSGESSSEIQRKTRLSCPCKP
jgi:hypothetical protein